MRITFVIPPSPFLLDERVFPSLGVLKVAASARLLGHDVDVVDLSGIPDWVNDFEEADVFGITATMPQMPAAAEIANLLRRTYPDARLILGGPHPTLLHSSLTHNVERARAPFAELTALFDTIVCGDGEKTLPLALSPAAPVVINADDPTSTLFLTAADLNAAPLPARDLIDIRSYRYAIDGVPTQSLIAQLGCPFGCNFCGGRRSPFLRRVRTRTTSAVIAEMAHLYSTYGTRGFMFLDDELNVNKEFMNLLDALIDLQRTLHVDFRLRGLLKSELVTEPMAARMFTAGFRDVLIGFESGDDRILTNMNKRATRAQNTRCVEILQAAGIRVKALMSLGHPGESPASVVATRDWLLEVRPDDFDVTIITVYPGTPYYDDSVLADGVLADGRHYTYTAANGDRLYQQPVDHLRDVNFYKGIPGSYQSFVWTDALSRADLVTCRDQVEQDVRAALALPYPTAPAACQYEHSMGMR